MLTYSATIALQDDDGNRYSLPTTKAAIVYVCRYHGEVFTIAQGIGIDTETEPVLVIQGTAPNMYQLNQLKSKLLHYAKTELNQRAVGWFTSDDSYQAT